jgi:hypothetical protein
MAIDKATFEKGIPARTLYDQILEFLTENLGNAYTDGEINKEMINRDGNLRTLTTVGQRAYLLSTLDNLIADGKVTARRPGISAYYMATEVEAKPPGEEGEEPNETAPKA